MPDTPEWGSPADRTGGRLRDVARQGRDAPWSATSGSVAGGPRRRPPGAPVAAHRRLALKASAGLDAIGNGWRQLLRRPGPALRRLSVVSFVALLLAGAVAGVLASRTSVPRGGEHALVGGATSSSTGSTTLPVGTSTSTSVVRSSTTTTVRTSAPGSTTTGAPTTTIPSPTTTTTTTVPSPALTGYQQVGATASSSCSLGGQSSEGSCSNGGPTATVTAECPSGDKVLGGGGSTSVTPQPTPSPPVASLTASDPTITGTGWTATGDTQLNGVAGTYTITVTAYAICAQVS